MTHGSRGHTRGNFLWSHVVDCVRCWAVGPLVGLLVLHLLFYSERGMLGRGVLCLSTCTHGMMASDAMGRGDRWSVATQWRPAICASGGDVGHVAHQQPGWWGLLGALRRQPAGSRPLLHQKVAQPTPQRLRPTHLSLPVIIGAARIGARRVAAPAAPAAPAPVRARRTLRRRECGHLLACTLKPGERGRVGRGELYTGLTSVTSVTCVTVCNGASCHRRW